MVRPEALQKCLDRHGPAEQVTLDIVAAAILENCQLPSSFSTPSPITGMPIEWAIAIIAEVNASIIGIGQLRRR